MKSRSSARVLVLGVGLAVGACPADGDRCDGAPPATLPVGTVPNDVAFAECEDGPVLLVPSSGDGRLDVFSLPCGEARGSVIFLPEGGAPAAPWAVAVDGERALVTLQGQGRVALLDVCAASILDARGLEEPLELPAPLTLSAPLDADGDGTTETTVTRLRPRAPEPVVTRDGQAFVAFTNLLEPGLSAEAPPVLGPGQLARFDLDDATLGASPAVVTLPCVNPQGLALRDDALWVSCSGALGPTASSAVAALSDGALVRVDPSSLEILELVDAGRFAPGTPALTAAGPLVGSLIEPALSLVEDGALTVAPVEGAPLEALFECAPLAEGARAQALCTQFSADRLLAVSTEGGAPVVNGVIALGAGSSLTRGAQALALAPASARELGVGAAVLLGLSAELALLPPEALP